MRLKSRHEGKDVASIEKEETPESSCWLDFVILHGEQAPELDQIRKLNTRATLAICTSDRTASIRMVRNTP